MQSIITPVYHDRIFDNLVQIPMDFLIASGEVYNSDSQSNGKKLDVLVMCSVRHCLVN